MSELWKKWWGSVEFCPQGQQDMESPAVVPGSLLFGLASFCNNIIMPLMHQSQKEESKIVAKSWSEADSAIPLYLLPFPWLHQQPSLEWIVSDHHLTNVRGKRKGWQCVSTCPHFRKGKAALGHEPHTQPAPRRYIQVYRPGWEFSSTRRIWNLCLFSLSCCYCNEQKLSKYWGFKCLRGGEEKETEKRGHSLLSREEQIFFDKNQKQTLQDE